jgi:hypothetical protein
MSLNILDFRIRVINELPPTKDFAVEQLMLEGIQDLCRITHCYIEASTTTSTVSIPTYALTPSTSTLSVVDFHEGKYNNVRLPKISNNEMDRRDAQWERRSGTPDAIIYDGDSAIRFNITPDTTGKAIQMESVIMPNNVSAVVPPKIERKHTEAIKAYVKWKIFEHPNTFNPDMAVYWRTDYMKRRSELSRQVILDGINMEAVPRSFVTGRVQSPLGVTVD